MRITVISHWYNEELLASLFLKHYQNADEIMVLLETDTNDCTRDILTKQSNVTIKDVHINGNDAKEMNDSYNHAISTVKEGWIYLVDADEFIFPENFENTQTFLERQTADIVLTTLFHVYKHRTEGAIDYEKKVIPQRIHGTVGIGNDFINQFIKPCVFRAEIGYAISIGNHCLAGEHTCSVERYIGAHWKMADSEIALRRRLASRERMSRANRKRGYWNHEYYITKERIEYTLRSHSKLPVVPFLVPKESE